MYISGSDKDYYVLLGVSEAASQNEIERQYKRQAAKHHPDLGGSEERMKSLNEAYTVLKNQTSRREYDATRKKDVQQHFAVSVTPAAQDVGVFGHCLSAIMCLFLGLFLLFLVRFQGIWFLWPLGILAALVIGFGILMARGAMVAVNSSLSDSNRWRRHTRIQEMAFWTAVGGGVFVVYLMLTNEYF
ncbi:MAG: J domain-containing protein [Pyrinomonadaceae bacterium]